MKRIVIATLNIEGLSNKKGIEINQLHVEMGFHIIVLTETKEIERGAKKAGRFGILSGMEQNGQ